MKNKDNVDDIIRSSSPSFDELMMQKFAQEAQSEIDEHKNKKKNEIIEDFKLLPIEFIFSNKSVYKLFNRLNKTESLINGLQFESYVANNPTLKKKLLDKKIDCFANEQYYIKFFNAQIWLFIF